MAKSKFPNELDSSVELPAVRNSALSEPINSIRSAVIQIERTLGINPQGSSGNTVSSRLNKVLDPNGNILPEALVQAGVISGPITDSDVSDFAAIKERKLDLNFPTQLLQDQISMAQSDIDAVGAQISELSIKLATHLSTSAVNRHPATAISVVSSEITGLDTAVLDLEADDVQEAFEDIHARHINYTGIGISETNNSHSANQVWFDNSNVAASISANDVQEALEFLSTNSGNESNLHQDIQHSNGLLRVGKLSDVDDSDLSEVLATDISVTFSSFDGNSEGVTTITVVDTLDISNYELRPFDFVKITDPLDTDENYVGIYEIKSFNEAGGIVLSIDIYGSFNSGSTSETVIAVGKNIERKTNEAGLLVSAVEEAGLTDSRILQVANPDSVRIISNQIRPTEVTSTNRFIDLTVDGETFSSLDLYNAALSRQTLDSIISRLNEQFAEQAANVLAYRIDFESGTSEIAIVHNIPDEVGSERTIIISRSSDDGIDALGFTNIEDLAISAVYGTKYFINGEVYSGLKKKLDSTDLAFFSGSNNISTGSSGIDFLQLGLKVGDLIIIEGAADSSDNGSYYVETISSTLIRVSSGQLPLGFNADSGDNLRCRIFASTISVEDITFDVVGSTFGSTILDVFINKDREIFYNKAAEYEAVISASTSVIDIVDFDTNQDFYNQLVTINANENPGDITSFLLDIDGGEPVEISGTDKYVWIVSGETNIKLKLYIPDAAAIGGKIDADGTGFSIPLTFLQKTNDESNMLLARVTYNNFNGRMVGGISGPRVLRKLSIGNINTKDIASTAKYEIIEKPRSELRYNGIIYGFEIENVFINSDNFYVLDIRRGLAFVNGKRIEKSTKTTIITDIDSASIDKFYVTLDEDGNYRIESALSNNCTSPFGETDFAIIGSVEFDGIAPTIIDLRLFIDHLDLKLLNSISVSPQDGMGHFKDPVKALKYAKRFGELFPDARTPIVHFKSGVHRVTLEYNYAESSLTWDPNTLANQQIFYDQQIESGFFIDFSVVIEGEGRETVIELVNESTWTDTSYTLTMPIIVAGSGFSAATRGFDSPGTGYFVEIRNLRLRNTRISHLDPILGSGIEFTQSLKINNVNFAFNNFPGNFIDGVNGPRAYEMLEVSNTTTNKGNVQIENCHFVDCGIYVDEISRTRNFSIINNIYFDADSSGNFLFNDLYTFSTALPSYNINILNNRNSSIIVGNGVSGPQMVAGSSDRWGDRFSRDVRIGDTLFINGELEVQGDSEFNQDITVQGTVNADFFNYNNPKTVRRTITFENQINGGAGNGSAAATTFRDNTPIGGSSWRTFRFLDSEVGFRFGVCRIPINEGEVLTAIAAQYLVDGTGTLSFGAYEFRIQERDVFGNETIILPYTSGGAGVPGGGSSDAGFSSLGGLSITAQQDHTYWLSIRRVNATGFDNYVYSVRFLYDVDSVEKAIGAG